MASVVKPPPGNTTPPASSFTDSDKWHALRVLTGLFGAPLAWMAQMSLCEPLAANACYPYRAPLSMPLWESLPLMLTAISLICGAIGLLAAFSAWSMWLRTGNQASVIADDGRAHFLAILAAMSSLVFVIAIIFTSCAILLVSPCHP